MDNCAAPSRTFREKVLRATDYIYRHNDRGHCEEAALDRIGGAGKGKRDHGSSAVLAVEKEARLAADAQSQLALLATKAPSAWGSGRSASRAHVC